MRVPADVLHAAQWLQQLDVPMVYVGGAVAPLYYQRPAFFGAERPTMDVDCNRGCIIRPPPLDLGADARIGIQRGPRAG
ncbi:MAG: hypothetical protein ACI8W8_003061 [Rhodothermales bacterium]|jgi:hypothetical protein